MFWPGAYITLIASIFLGIILLIVVIILRNKKNDELKTYYKNYQLRIVFWLTLCTVFYLVSNTTLIKIQYNHDPELVRLKIQSYKNPENEEYRNALNNYNRQSDSLYMVKQRQGN